MLVVGGGNAALCAAISARREGASVLVLEGAPKFYRGGNTRHTRNLRCAHEAATATLTGPYTEEEFWDDLLQVTDGHTDELLARHMVGFCAALGILFISKVGGLAFDQWMPGAPFVIMALANLALLLFATHVRIRAPGPTRAS